MNRAAPILTWINADDPSAKFPPLESAFREPDGLIAAGGDLSPGRLLHAYRHGIFPWYDEGQPILWWSPDPRCVLRPGEFHVSRRLRRSLRRSDFQISFNTAFEQVIKTCREPRVGQLGTWITNDMLDAYCQLHSLGWAQSVEVWLDGSLIGGLYGIAIGQAFFGESMFSRKTNASKAAMLALCTELVSNEYQILDCQVASPHLSSLGAFMMPRTEFATFLASAAVASKPQSVSSSKMHPITDFLA